jgi:hypothetical protein
MPTIRSLVITEQEREPQRRVRAHTTPQRAAKRARVVLLAVDGLPNRQIAPWWACASTRLATGGVVSRLSAWPAWTTVHGQAARWSTATTSGCGSWPP